MGTPDSELACAARVVWGGGGVGVGRVIFFAVVARPDCTFGGRGRGRGLATVWVWRARGSAATVFQRWCPVFPHVGLVS